tara:strand:+ start:212 stop:523 length:312 start_codon:yes stop_codon:yes gene_type:complete
VRKGDRDLPPFGGERRSVGTAGSRAHLTKGHGVPVDLEEALRWFWNRHCREWCRRKEKCLLAYILVLDDVETKADVLPFELSYKLDNSVGPGKSLHLVALANT